MCPALILVVLALNAKSVKSDERCVDVLIISRKSRDIVPLMLVYIWVSVISCEILFARIGRVSVAGPGSLGVCTMAEYIPYTCTVGGCCWKEECGKFFVLSC